MNTNQEMIQIVVRIRHLEVRSRGFMADLHLSAGMAFIKLP